MSNKVNIFTSLHVDNSDDEDRQSGYQSRKEKKQAAKTASTKTDTKSSKLTQEERKNAVKEDLKKAKETPSSGSHPYERHSGTGYSAFDKKTLKKGGHGKGNAGRPVADDKAQDEPETQNEEVEQVEEKPEGITLEEYKARIEANKPEPEINEAKAKITQEDLMKEILAKKATPLVPRKQEAVPQPTNEKKKTKEVTHKAEINTEYAELLQFRTGFIERAFRDRSKPEESKPKREEKAEGEKQPENPEGGETQSPTGDDERKGGNRGGNKGGYRDRGGNKGNYKGGNKGGQPKLNLQDESDFPKLG